MGEDGWYEEQVKKMDEESKLSKEKSTKSMNLFTQKQKELRDLSSSKDNEIKSLDNHNSERSSIIFKSIIKISFGILLIILFIVWFIAKLNKVIRSKNKVKECLAQIDVVLKRRYDLIPNIVSVVKGCTNHESKTLEEVTKMRTNALKTKDKKEEMELNNNISKDINQILLLSESYPELKSNENYLSLQLELSATEDEIAKEREEYNNAVLKYKNIIETIPTNIFAKILGYKDESFFSTDDDESKNHKLDLKN